MLPLAAPTVPELAVPELVEGLVEGLAEGPKDRRTEPSKGYRWAVPEFIDGHSTPSTSPNPLLSAPPSSLYSSHAAVVRVETPALSKHIPPYKRVSQVDVSS